MISKQLLDSIISYEDFPKKGILFRDLIPILRNPELFSNLIDSMSSKTIFDNADAIIAVDARGFIFGTAIALKLKKPLIVARKPGKLPGELYDKKYNLEYGNNSLSIQKDSISPFQKFVIVDDLLATGGTVNCVDEIIKDAGKKVEGLSVVVELNELNAREKFSFPVCSEVSF